MDNQEKDIELSFCVCTVPCPEEYYMGVNAHYDAYVVNIPRSLFPIELLDAIERKNPNKVLTNIYVAR